MRMTITIDDELLHEAMRLTGAKTVSEVVDMALKALVRMKRQERSREPQAQD